jgi:hypothetical protein
MCGACATGPRIEPQVGVRRTGERYAPLPEGAAVKVYRRGAPAVSYREVGAITATCPVKRWVGGREESGRPVCEAGLRQGARELGAQAVVDVEVEAYAPGAAPERRWLVMEGVGVRLTR